MKNKMIYERTIALIFLLGITWMACHKEARPDPPTIAGEWECLVCVNNDQYWSFNDSTQVATQTYSALGQQVFTNLLHYSQDGDTIRFFNLASYRISKWALRFEGNDRVNIRAVGDSFQPIQILIRKK